MTPWSLYRTLSSSEIEALFRPQSDLKFGLVFINPTGEGLETKWGVALKTNKAILPLFALPEEVIEWATEYVVDSWCLSVPENPEQDFSEPGTKTLFPETEVSKFDGIGEFWVSVPKSWANYWMPNFESFWLGAFQSWEAQVDRSQQNSLQNDLLLARWASIRYQIGLEFPISESQQPFYWMVKRVDSSLNWEGTVYWQGGKYQVRSITDLKNLYQNFMFKSGGIAT